MSLSTTKTRDYPKSDPRRGVNYLKFIGSTTYTTTNEDKGQVLIFTGAATTVTLAALSVPVGSQIDFIRRTSGVLTFVAGSGVIVYTKSVLTLSTLNTAATAIKLSATEWFLVGDLS
jgi:hypothetical protein